MLGRTELMIVLWTLASGVPAAAKPWRSVRVQRGYIDAHFAVSPDGKKLAFLHVLDDATAWLVVEDQRGRVLFKSNVAKHVVMPSRVRFAPDGGAVLVSWHVGRIRGHLLADLAAKKVRFLGRFRDVRFHKTVKGYQVVGYDRRDVAAGTVHTVTVMAYPSLRVQARVRLRTDRRQRLTNPAMKLLYFRNDYLVAVGKIAGRYDKKRDIRLPDRQAVYDLLRRRVISDEPIKDAVAWEKMRLFRQKHPALDPVVVIEREQPDRPRLVRVDEQNRRSEIRLPVELLRFDPASLRQQVLPGGTLVFSLTIDPQNPLALQQKRSDKRVFYLFSLKPTSTSAKLLFKLPSEGIEYAWSLGGRLLAVMRLHEHWGLGWDRLDLYRP